ncbi:hypothetical protein DB31_4190 [Hyalangium minutum]|uniref:Uncharacterized protein n=1 Tax=Hyalangium minutum TaxID=394096 RepID=A0A085W321_9BACT|nr:hypothetical protein DB31_4190 [Hyalangium minutum]
MPQRHPAAFPDASAVRPSVRHPIAHGVDPPPLAAALSVRSDPARNPTHVMRSLVRACWPRNLRMRSTDGKLGGLAPHSRLRGRAVTAQKIRAPAGPLEFDRRAPWVSASLCRSQDFQS